MIQLLKFNNDNDNNIDNNKDNNKVFDDFKASDTFFKTIRTITLR